MKDCVKRELEVYKKELENYKKAFTLACKELDIHANSSSCEMTPISIRGVGAIKEYYLKKAREE